MEFVLLKLLAVWFPSVATAPITTMRINASMTAYSTEVAADKSLKNRRMRVSIGECSAPARVRSLGFDWASRTYLNPTLPPSLVKPAQGQEHDAGCTLLLNLPSLTIVRAARC